MRSDQCTIRVEDIGEIYIVSEIIQPSLFEPCAMADRLYFVRQFEALENEQSDWIDNLDVEYPGDLHFGDFVSWYWQRLTKSQKQWADGFVKRWFDLADKADKEQICFDCRQYTHVADWVLYEGKLRCEKCRKKL